MAEKEVQNHPNYLILRPTVIYGWQPEGKNFFMQVYYNQLNKKTMNVPPDQISNPTYVVHLVEVIKRAIKKNLDGIYNATGSESISRYDFAIKICDVFGFDKSLIVRKTTEELQQAAKRPLNCSTDSSKIQKALNYHPPSLNDSLRELKVLFDERTKG